MDVEDDDADGSAEAAPANGVSDLDVRSEKTKTRAPQISVSLCGPFIPDLFPLSSLFSFQFIIQQWLRSKQTSDPDAKGGVSSDVQKVSADAAANNDGDDDEEDDGPVDESELGYAGLLYFELHPDGFGHQSAAYDSSRHTCLPALSFFQTVCSSTPRFALSHRAR